MIAGFVIALREGLEAALIVGIVLAFLAKTQSKKGFRQVYAGVGAAIAASIGFAFLFQWIAGGFAGPSAELFEGVTTLIAAALLTSMIIWMEYRGPQLKEELERQTRAATISQSLGIFSIVFIAVLREGVETVIFLTALPSEGLLTILGAIIGFIVAVSLAYVYFSQSRRFSLKTFFQVTSILLLIFAAGMIAYGIHELQEAGAVPILIEHLWDVNFLLNENSPIGLVLKGLVGYNANPSLIEVLAYFSYLLVMLLFFLLRRRYQRTISQ